MEERSSECQLRLTTELTHILRDPPVGGNESGLARCRSSLGEAFRSLGFEVSERSASEGQPVLLAYRDRGAPWVGCAGHYDVEDAGEGWSTDPYEPTLRDGRLYARGIGDNLGPLLLRLQAVERLAGGGPSLLFVLQGEEEVGSGAAHELYPSLDLPPIALWLEETGYFEDDGTQRLLVRRCDELAEVALAATTEVARRHGRAVVRHDRYLNKAFGIQRCPFLTHLVGDRPYFAIGPNDTESRIHAANESLAVKNLGIAVDQNLALFRALERVP